MQKLGQHFLKNDAVIKKIIGALDLQSGDAVVEIGPGHGELTVPLSVACIAVGASLSVIEKDTKLAEALRGKLNGVGIIHGDALAVLPEAIEEAKKNPGSKKCKIVGNIPYYITGKLLRTIGELKPEQKPERSILMVQREVADRIVAAPPDMNRLAASVQFWATAEIIAHVPKSDFSPPPKIDSAVILLTTQNDGSPTDSTRYFEALRSLFAQPRKTIINNLSSPKTTRSKVQISQALIDMKLDPAARPQNLSVEDIFRIAKTLF